MRSPRPRAALLHGTLGTMFCSAAAERARAVAKRERYVLDSIVVIV